MSEPSIATGPRAAAVRRVGLWLGPALFAAILASPIGEGWAPEARRTLAVLAWVGAWWLTEPVHSAVAALLPFVLLPALGVMSSKEAARGYQEDAIFLFLGGFLLAAALENSGVHRRMADAVLRAFGARPRRIVFGFGVATMFVSMWLSNAATTLLMLPAAVALGDAVREANPTNPRAPRFGIALALTTAICSTVGGMATPVGTVPNMIMVTHARAAGLEDGVTFAAWASIALPIAVGLMLAHYVLATFVTCRYPADLVVPRPPEGAPRAPWTAAQITAATTFAVVVLLWLTRRDVTIGGAVIPGWSTWATSTGLLPAAAKTALGDGAAATAGAVVLFVLRPKGETGPLLRWDDVERRIPWGVLFLLGSSFVLADAFETPKDGGGGKSLSNVAAEALRGAGALPDLARLFVLALGTALISEIGSNTAVAALCVPIGFAAAKAAGHAPLAYGYAVAFGASCSFALPVSTPPNTLVYGAGRVPLAIMVGHGLLLDLVAAPLIALRLG